MNELLKFTIVITVVEFIGFILLQCVLLLSNSMKTMKELLTKKLTEEASKNDSKKGVPK